MVGGQAYRMDGDIQQGWGHLAGCWGMQQGVGTCCMSGGRVWRHLAGGGGMCGVSGLWHKCGRGGTCGMVWGHVAGCEGMWQGWWQGVGACGRGRGAWMGTCGRGGACGRV